MEIKFKRDTTFRKQFFVPESFAHPAKMDAQLLIWIVEHYTEAGETILDPMAGSGTMMLACTLGRNVVLVELEEKFCKMMRDNWEKVLMRPQLGSTMGTCQIIQGDARNLSGLLADKVVFSPPYAEAHDKDPGGLTKTNRKDLLPYSYLKDGSPDNIQNLPYGQIDKIVTSPPYSDISMGGGLNTKPPREGHDDQSGRNPNSPSQVDSIITSPPYEGTTGEGKEIGSKGHAVGAFHYGNDSRQIGNLKSQSYLEAMLRVYQSCYKVLKPCVMRCGCGIIEAEVGNGQTLSGRVLRRGRLRGVDRQGGKIDSRAEIKRSPEPNQGLLGKSGLSGDISLPSKIQIHPHDRGAGNGVSASGSKLPEHQDNSERLDAIPDSEKGRCNQDIAGDRQEASTHGEAERGRCDDAEESGAIVSQDREVLPLLKQEDTGNSSQERDANTCPKCNQEIRYEGGLLILVTKNFIRNKQVIRLDEDTIKLCEQVGFSYLERHYRKLPSQSFWRIIYHQKHPEVEQILNEDVLVFGK